MLLCIENSIKWKANQINKWILENKYSKADYIFLCGFRIKDFDCDKVKDF